jgi:ribonuclease MRP protein subunit RMP1
LGTEVRLISDRAFSNLVADNQYSALGLVLLGCLARVKSVIGMLVEDEGMDGVTETGVGEEESVMREVEVKDDFGEVVSRKEILGDIDESLIEVNEEGDDAKEQSGGQVEQETTDESQHITMARSRKKKGPSPLTDRDKRPGNEISTPSKPPKKKRKKGDAFDDLFSSLI